MRRRLSLAGTFLVLATTLVTATAAAAINFQPARKLCESQGGTFSADPDFYRCVFLDGTAPTAAERRAARRLCQERYGGVFMYAPAGAYTDPAYGCDLA